MVDNVAPSIDVWLDHLRDKISHEESLFLDLFETYAAEAKFGRSFIDADLKRLSEGDHILEVGAGAMILSCQLAIEGYAITALEPTGDGFSHFSRLREIVLEQAKKVGAEPSLLLLPAEKMTVKNQYGLAFSINVMEHVDNVAVVVERVINAMHSKGVYHFTCPNYLFPYEPHFNIPTLFSKRLTEFFFSSLIYNNKKMPDPVGTWRSLNWISVTQLNKIIKQVPKATVSFNIRMLRDVFLRMTTDSVFSARRSNWMRVIIKVMVLLKIHNLMTYLPSHVQPIIDCTITKLEK